MLTDVLQAYIGRKAQYTAPEELGRALIRYFARAVGDPNPIYTDTQAARESGYDDVIAPPTLVCETLQYLDQPRDEDGYIGEVWNLPLPDCRAIRGGNEYEFFQPVHPTDIVTGSWTLPDITEKRSSSGSPLLVVISTVEYRNQHHQLLATNRETMLYQPLTSEEEVS